MDKVENGGVNVIDPVKNVRPLYLKEFFLLKQNQQVIEKFPTSTEEERLQSGLELLLRDIFLVRRDLDPGFRVKIYDDLLQNKEILNSIRKVLLRSTNDFNEFREELQTAIEVESTRDHVVPTSLVLEEAFNNVIKIPTTIHPIPDKVDTFTKYWINQWKKGETLKAMTIENLILEMQSGFSQSHRNLSSESEYDNEPNYVKYQYQMIGELLVSIKGLLFDYIEAQRNNLILLSDMRILIDNHLNGIKSSAWHLYREFYDFIDQLELLKEDYTPFAIDTGIFHKEFIHKDGLLENGTIVDQIGNYDLSEHLVRIGFSDLLTILSLLYFKALSFEEKIVLLNKFFGLEYIITDHPKHNLKDNFYGIYSILTWLKHLEAYQDIVDLLGALLDECDTLKRSQEHYLVYERILASINANHVKKGVKQLELAKADISEVGNQIIENPLFHSLTVPSRESSVFILMQQVQLLAFTYCLLTKADLSYAEKQNEAIGLISKIIELSGNPSIKRFFLITLAQIARMNGNFKGEYCYLVEAETQFQGEADIWLSELDLARIRKRMHDFDAIQLNIQQMPRFMEVKTFDMTINRALLYQSMGDFQRAINLIQSLESIVNTFNDNKRLLIYYEAIIYPLMYLEKNRESLDYLEKALHTNPDDIYYLSYLLGLNIIEENFPLSREVFIRFIDFLEHEKVGYLEYWHLMRNLVEKLGIKTFLDVIQKLIEEYDKSKGKKGSLLIDIGNFLADIGFFDQSLSIYKQALLVVENDVEIGQIYTNIGSVFTNLSQYTEAEEYYQKAIGLDYDSFKLYRNLAKNYMFQLDYIRAKDALEIAISKASKLHLSPNLIENMIYELSHFSFAKIARVNVHSIPFQEVRDHFIQGEKLFKNFVHSSTKIDITNPIVSSYTNGVELYLDKTITVHFKQRFVDMYGKDCKRIPEWDWRNLDSSLQSVFRGRQITMGAWEVLMDKFQQISNDNARDLVLNEFKDCLPFKDVDNVIKIVKNATEFLTPIRNSSSHGTIIPYEEFNQLYPQIIKTINEVINAFTE